MVIDNKVYNITSFLEEHPGGEDVLLDTSGRDATREFEDVGHSGEARAQLEGLFIGELRDPTPEEIAKAEEEAKLRGEAISSQSTSLITSLAKWIVPLLLVGVAYVLRRYGK